MGGADRRALRNRVEALQPRDHDRSAGSRSERRLPDPIQHRGVCRVGDARRRKFRPDRRLRRSRPPFRRAATGNPPAARCRRQRSFRRRPDPLRPRPGSRVDASGRNHRRGGQTVPVRAEGVECGPKRRNPDRQRDPAAGDRRRGVCGKAARYRQREIHQTAVARPAGNRGAEGAARPRPRPGSRRWSRNLRNIPAHAISRFTPT